MTRRASVDLLAQPPHEDVDGAVAVTLTATPQALQQLVARDDPAPLERECVQKPELRRRQVGALAVHVRLHLVRVDPQLLDLNRLAAHRLQRPRAPSRLSLDPGHELLHRERLDEVVVGADLERVHAIVLRAARRDDDDRRADALAANGLDEVPAVEPGQHEVEDADVGVLEAEPSESLLAARRRGSVEPGGLEVLHHPACDDLVVLDDQDLGHRVPTIVGWRRKTGERRVNRS